MIKFRAVNIYPSSLDALISTVPGLGSEYQIHLSRDESERGIMRLVVERAEQAVSGADPDPGQTLQTMIKKKLLVSPTVEVVDYGSLPRSVRKSQRVFDTRLNDEEIVG